MIETSHTQVVREAGKVERRHHFRWKSHCRAEVQTETGARFAATIANLSPAGLNLEGGQELIESVFDRRYQPGLHSPVTFKVYFILPDADAHCEEVRGICSSIFVGRRYKGHFVLGARFLRIEEGAAALERFLNACR
ncbi:PilZ domain-containing protein [Pseudomaricurvus alkylphenolicus]|jgi:hypothetical protein|uniref:PilZ domain-containing protein n=1 Tax=Pseudomaricurvus alkylphenolicus TaxID=1306991 RepID=UPI0014222882|nr:PilZ domain-containing protein [Pseudomaricurvus alkylphenolicus]NIB42938.1 PilZ domain-containing protein [Pseudomaricurvus alkylphenolicus]